MDLLKDVLVEVAKTVANSTVVYLFSFLPAKKVKENHPFYIQTARAAF